MGFGFLKGWTSIALTGQESSQLKQVQQSDLYLIAAFPVSSISMTSPGQNSAQMPQPMHASLSIFRIIVLTPSFPAKRRAKSTSPLWPSIVKVSLSHCQGEARAVVVHP